MGFGDCDDTKYVIIVDFKQKTPDIALKKVPIFRKLEKISGNTEEIISRIRELKESQQECLVEIEYTDSTPPEEFRELAEKAAKDSGVEILRIKSKYSWDKILKSVSAEESLEDVTPQEVFQRVLDINSVPEEEQKELEAMHLEILNLVLEEENYENT
jgi:exonuclease SbcD